MSSARRKRGPFLRPAQSFTANVDLISLLCSGTRPSTEDDIPDEYFWRFEEIAHSSPKVSRPPGNIEIRSMFGAHRLLLCNESFTLELFFAKFISDRKMILFRRLTHLLVFLYVRKINAERFRTVTKWTINTDTEIVLPRIVTKFNFLSIVYNTKMTVLLDPSNVFQFRLKWKYLKNIRRSTRVALINGSELLAGGRSNSKETHVGSNELRIASVSRQSRNALSP